MRMTFGKLVRSLTPTLWRPVLGLALTAAIAAGCGGSTSSNPGSGGTSGTAGSSGGNSGGGTTGSGGNTAGSGGSGVAGTVGSGGNSTGGAGGGSGGTGGNVGSGGNSTGGAGGGTAGAASGSGGGAGNGGGGTTGGAQAGRGGASAGSGGAAAGAGGRGGSGGSTGTGGSGNLTRPSNATFCSGFDATSTDPPTGAIYMVNAAPGAWTRDFVIDTAVKNSGAGSLRVKSASGDSGTSGIAYKMLAVPSGGSAFWVRFFMRSDAAIGMAEHNVFAGASTGNGPNDGLVEFAEDVGIGFNTSDDVRSPPGYGRLPGGGTMPYSLAANTWHCIEISFDGTGRVQQLFVGGNQLINATAYPTGAARAFTWFKFGFNQLHGPARALWYDDVAVSPTRVGGCQ